MTDITKLRGIKVGVAVCGSFCTFSKVFDQFEELAAMGCQLTPIMSYNAYSLDTRFGKAQDHAARLYEITGRTVIRDITEAEPIGPKKLFDVLVVAPCTGNTLAKLALGITDTPVCMAVKSHLRNQRPVVLAVSTNDALSGAAKTSEYCATTRISTLYLPIRMTASESPFPCLQISLRFPRR